MNFAAYAASLAVLCSCASGLALADDHGEDHGAAGTAAAEAMPAMDAAVETGTMTMEAETVDYLIMEPNAEIVFITTGGAEVRADWTEAAKVNLQAGFVNQVGEAGYSITEFEEPVAMDDALQQLLFLYEVVSASAETRMPHKPEGRNEGLTLGANASLLRDAYGADRAIFIDHYSQIESSGVFMTQVLVSAATGYTPPSQNFRATIGTVVDLETGALEERAIAALGDARDETESANIVSRVLRNLPLE